MVEGNDIAMTDIFVSEIKNVPWLTALCPLNLQRVFGSDYSYL